MSRSTVNSPVLRAIVCGEEKIRGSNVMVSASRLRLASEIAWRKLPGPPSFVLVTVKVAPRATVEIPARNMNVRINLANRICCGSSVFIKIR